MKKIAKVVSELVGLPGTLVIITLALLNWLVIGCSSEKPLTEVTGGAAAAPTAKSGAELWAENCIRCHNIRSPSNYSPAQWEVVMMHMRVRANLTPEEHKKILEFFKSGT